MSSRKVVIRYFCFDVAATLIVWLLFYLYRRFTYDFVLNPDAAQDWILPSYSLMLSMLIFPIVSAAVHYLSGYYNTREKRSRLTEFFTTVVASFIISIIIYFILLIDDDVVSYRSYFRSFMVLWGLFFVVTYTIRLIQTTYYIRCLRRGMYGYNLLVIGTGVTAKKVAAMVKANEAKHGEKFVGYVSVNPHCEVDPNMVVGVIGDLERLVAEKDVTNVIVAVDDMNNDFIYSVVNRLIVLGVEVKFTLRLFEIVTGRRADINFDSEPLVNMARTYMPAWQQSVKRAFDVAVALVAAVLVSPVMFYVALRVKRDSDGPVLYRQKRVGRDGKEFTIYKFRTMYVDSEQAGPQLASTHDSRITPFGLVMRKYRLDELPQLWNILRGDMSVVGPRPERRYYIEQIERIAPYYCMVYRVQPGLFSWGPIKIGYCDTVEKMVDRLNYDLVYIDNMSIFNDIKIILYSIEVLLKGEGQ